MAEDPCCEECGGAGIEFRGTGLEMQYKICSAYKTSDEPANHPTMTEVKGKIRETLVRVRPSGRFA